MSGSARRAPETESAEREPILVAQLRTSDSPIQNESTDFQNERRFLRGCPIARPARGALLALCVSIASDVRELVRDTRSATGLTSDRVLLGRVCEWRQNL